MVTVDWNVSNFFLGHAFTNMLVSHFLSGEFRNLIGRQIHMTWSVLKMLATKKVKIKSSSGVHGPKLVGLGPAKLRYLGPAWTRTGPGQNFENLAHSNSAISIFPPLNFRILAVLITWCLIYKWNILRVLFIDGMGSVLRVLL